MLVGFWARCWPDESDRAQLASCIRAAYDRLKEFPWNLPDEAARWMELRDAVARVVKG